MQKLNKAPPLYDNYKERTTINTFEQAEERIQELQDHIEHLESDGEMEFFERITTLEERMKAIEKQVGIK